MGAGRPEQAVLRQALEHADALYSLARALAGDQAAEELVQETYTRALAAAGQFSPGTNLRAWLARILRNAAIDRLRKEGGPPPLSTEEQLAQLDRRALEDAPTLGAPQLRALIAADVAQAVRALPEAWRAVVLLDLEGFSERETAAVLQCPEGTVKSRLFRARAALRERLADHHLPHEDR